MHNTCKGSSLLEAVLSFFLFMICVSGFFQIYANVEKEAKNKRIEMEVQSIAMVADFVILNNQLINVYEMAGLQSVASHTTEEGISQEINQMVDEELQNQFQIIFPKGDVRQEYYIYYCPKKENNRCVIYKQKKIYKQNQYPI